MGGLERRPCVSNTGRAVPLRPTTVPAPTTFTLELGFVLGHPDLVGGLSSPNAVSHQLPAEPDSVRLDTEGGLLVGTP